MFVYILILSKCLICCILLVCSDMIKRRNLRTRSIKMLILDESDEMLNKGTSTLHYFLFVRTAYNDDIGHRFCVSLHGIY